MISRMMLAITFVVSLGGLQPALANQTGFSADRPAPAPARPLRQEPRDFFPPWEGSGVYAFGPLLLDLNRKGERWVPGSLTPLFDCSNEEVYCLTARRGDYPGVVAFALPRSSCAPPRVGDSWSSGEVRTTVLARIEPSSEPVRDAIDSHTRRTATIYYLGDESNPKIVYAYSQGSGNGVIYHG